ncbi:MAG TPA: pseudouridine synthase [Vulgatibacter sp.]|nr:pseudouridine synthase [Vulgatibacter sp.]
MAEERLQKILSRAGIASRRAAEALILEGKVAVNGRVVRELGTRADPARDVIRVGERVIAEPEELVHLVLYKPERVVTTLADPEGRACVGDLIRRARLKVYPVGRLDYDAEGALLLTNDGDLAHKLTHPRWGVPRTYLAKVKGAPGEVALERLRAGVRLEDGMARALKATFEKQTPKNAWIRLVVTEGRHHLVKRLCEAVGHPVVRLFRSDYGGVGVAGMRPGDLRPLTGSELQALRKAVENEAPLPPGGRPRRRRTQVAVRDPIYGTTRPAGGRFTRGAGPGGPARGGAPRTPSPRSRAGGRAGVRPRGPAKPRR